MKMKFLLIFGTILLFCIMGNLASSKLQSPAIVHEAGAWPHLVGRLGKDAVDDIKKEQPALKVVIVPQGSMVTMDYRTDRVRVFVDKQGIVSGVPRVG